MPNQKFESPAEFFERLEAIFDSFSGNEHVMLSHEARSDGPCILYDKRLENDPRISELKQILDYLNSDESLVSEIKFRWNRQDGILERERSYDANKITLPPILGPNWDQLDRPQFPSHRPPRSFENAARFFISRRNQEAVLGDLEEVYPDQVAQMGNQLAKLWYAKEVFLIICGENRTRFEWVFRLILILSAGK